MNVNHEQLEAEADALINLVNTPPAEPDTVVAAGKDEVVAVEPEPASQEPSPETTDTDGLEDMTLENSAERIRNSQARMTRATTEAAQLRRSLSEQELVIQRLEDEVKRLQTELQAAPAKPPATDTATNGMATLETLREDYPQIIGPLIGSLQELRGELDGLKGTVATREASLARRDATENENRAKQQDDAHFNVIRAAHPDFQQVVESEDFQGWSDRQSRTTKIILYGDGVQGSPLRNGGKAEEVNDVLTQYKHAVGLTKRSDAAREAASPTLRKANRVQSNGRTTFTRDQIARMSAAEYAVNESAIDAAMAEGRVN